MKQKRSVSFRFYMITLFGIMSLMSLLFMGSIILFYRIPILEKNNRETVFKASEILAKRTEVLLNATLEKLRLFASASRFIDVSEINYLLEDLIDENGEIQGILLIDEAGIVLSASSQGQSYQSGNNLVGSDMSYNPLYKSAKRYGKAVWSDKYLSLLAGDTTIGVAVPAGKYTAIAEISLDYLLLTIKLAVGQAGMDVWVIDGRGEVVADTEGFYKPGIDNLMGLPFVRDASTREQSLYSVKIDNVQYNIASSHSAALGWIFLTRIPSGMAHPDIKSRIFDMYLLVLTQLLLILILTPIASRSISSSIRELAIYASEISENRVKAHWDYKGVREINSLAENLSFMFHEIENREQSLRNLNKELEQRVQLRTMELNQSNKELTLSLDHLNLMKDELVEAEKLSALGGLVAGVSHELNTPLGNALMTVTTMLETQENFEQIEMDTLSVSDLENYKHNIAEGLGISLRNLEKAAELVRSFKQVAVDQTSSKRREFSLGEMLKELLLTLQPLIKRHDVKLSTDFEEGIVMNSYPGMLGQVITNLISNAVEHGLQGRESRELRLSFLSTEDQNVFIIVEDNGKGMSEQILKKVFDPFFTTRLAEGGTGLGLSIAFNGTKQVLGGILEVRSREGEGSSFSLKIPMHAPRLINGVSVLNTTT